MSNVISKKSLLGRILGLPRTNPRLVVQLVLVVLGSVGIALSWPCVYQPRMPYPDKQVEAQINQYIAYEWAKDADKDVRGIWRGIATTLLLVGLVDLLSSGLARLVKSRDRRDFERFFGHAATQPGGGLVAVFNSPTVDEKHLVFGNAPLKARDAQAVAEGIEHVVPYEDLRATIAISREFASFESQMEIAIDSEYKEVWPEGKSMLAVGLGFNAVTERIALIKPGLLHVVYDENTPNGNVTDAFLIGTPPVRYNTVPGYDHALLVRVPDPEDPNRVFLICAGRTAEGTEAACSYLASHWRDVLRQYKNPDVNGNPHGLTESLAMCLRHAKGKPDTVTLETHVFM